MNLTALDVSAVVDKLVVPSIAAVVAWLVKDVLVRSYVARREEARREWLYRLREVYSPLWMWSGVVRFAGEPGKDRFGVSQLADTLSRAANLLPIREYFVFIKLLEQATGQATTAPSLKDIQKARDYVYSRIEVLNVALFVQPGYFQLTRPTDLFSSVRDVWRTSVDSLIQLAIWLTLTVIVVLVYRAVAGNSLALALTCILLLLILVEEVRRRIRWQTEINKRL